MRFSQTAVWTAAAVLGLASVTFAQGPGGGRGGFGGRGGRGLIGLANAEAVQKDAGIEADAKEKIAKLSTSFQEEMRSESSGGGNFREMSQEERQKAMAKMTETRAKLEAKFLPQLKEILSAEQLKRVKEIHVQEQGASALTNAEFAKELGLSDDQQKKIADLIREYGEKTRGLFGAGAGGGDGGGREAFAKMQEINKERDEKVVGVLSAEQKEKFTAAKGKAFDLAALRQGGPGGGPGNRPRRPANDDNN